MATYNFSIKATDANGCIGVRNFNLEVGCPVITLDDSLPDGLLDESYTGEVTASGGTGPYTYAVTAGTLPAGLTLSSSGELSGTPEELDDAVTFEITATDTYGCTGSRSYTMLVACACSISRVLTAANIQFNFMSVPVTPSASCISLSVYDTEQILSTYNYNENRDEWNGNVTNRVVSNFTQLNNCSVRTFGYQISPEFGNMRIYYSSCNSGSYSNISIGAIQLTLTTDGFYKVYVYGGGYLCFFAMVPATMYPPNFEVDNQLTEYGQIPLPGDPDYPGGASIYGAVAIGGRAKIVSV